MANKKEFKKFVGTEWFIPYVGKITIPPAHRVEYHPGEWFSWKVKTTDAVGDLLVLYFEFDLSSGDPELTCNKYHECGAAFLNVGIPWEEWEKM